MTRILPTAAVAFRRRGIYPAAMRLRNLLTVASTAGLLAVPAHAADAVNAVWTIGTTTIQCSPDRCDVHVESGNCLDSGDGIVGACKVVYDIQIYPFLTAPDCVDIYFAQGTFTSTVSTTRDFVMVTASGLSAGTVGPVQSFDLDDDPPYQIVANSEGACPGGPSAYSSTSPAVNGHLVAG
jgi:hypothetical protein